MTIGTIAFRACRAAEIPRHQLPQAERVRRVAPGSMAVVSLVGSLGVVPLATALVTT